MSTANEEGGLTDKGYWALLQNAGIKKIRLMEDGVTWLATNRNRSIFPVPDPSLFNPAQRRDVANSIISENEDS